MFKSPDSKTLFADSLIAGDDDCVDDVIHGSAAGKVINGSSETLQDRSYSLRPTIGVFDTSLIIRIFVA